MKLEYRPDIDGLRAIAVISVVLYHAKFVLFGISLFSGGYLGVDIFFVISGYLISNIVISELNSGTFSFKRFYIKRISRIIPALIVTIILTIPFAYFLLTPKAMQEYLSSMFSAIFFYANYYFQNLDFYISESTKVMPFLHTWTLAIEEQYYILFPIITFLIFKYKKNYIVSFFIFVSFFSIFLNSQTQELTKFYQIQFRVWELLAGVIIMILSTNFKIKNLEKIGIAFIMFSVYYFDDSYINSIEPKIFATFGTILIIISNNKNSYLTIILKSKVFKAVGLSSFSIYLFHQPIFAFMTIYYTQINWETIIDTKLSLKEISLGILLSIFLGYFNYLFIEKYFIKSKNTKLIFVLVFFTLIMNFALDNAENRKNISQSNKLVEFTVNIENYTAKISDTVCHDVALIENMCSFNEDKENKVILIGDSHLRELGYLLSQNLPNYNFEILTGNSCLFLIDQDFNELCPMLENQKQFKEYILNQKNVIFIYGGDIWDEGYSHLNLHESIPNTFKKLILNENKIIAIEQIPNFPFNPIEKIYQDKNLENNVKLNYEYWENQILINPQLRIYKLIKDDSLYTITPENYICNNIEINYCVAALGDKIFYRDSNHLTVDGINLFLFDLINLIDSISNKI